MTTLLLIVFLGCTKEDTYGDKELRLAVSEWVGYLPIYYADEKGWLKEANIDIIQATSLNETVHYFQANLIDAFVTTQYEARLLDKNSSIHIMALDRSDGGDIILSNRPLDTILKSKKVKVYMERDTVNELVLEGFIKHYSLSSSKFELRHKEQLNVKNISPNSQEDIMIITYEPYITQVKKNGFKEIASTKNSNILILDSLYSSDKAYIKHRKQIDLLQILIKKAFKNLTNNPKEFYNTIKHIVDGQSYEDFQTSLSQIEWLIDKDSKYIDKLIEHHNILPVEK